MAAKPTTATIPLLHNRVIDMAWCDVTSFDAIHLQTGLAEKDVIKIMRRYLKPASFRLWRKRVSGRKAKHARLLAEKHDQVTSED